MELVKEGKLTFPLFHGTSSLFVDSIFDSGLGGDNPIRQLEVLPFLRNLYEICQQTLCGDPEWLSRRWLVEQMITQRNPALRHGNSFLSPSRDTAVRYALSNPFGSEIISTALKFYNLLIEREPDRKVDPRLIGFPVVAVFNRAPEPVLVKASRVDISCLQGEQGQSAQQVITGLANMLSGVGTELFAVVSQQSNFRLIKPIDVRQLRLYYIKPTDDDPIFPEYDLKPLKPH